MTVVPRVHDLGTDGIMEPSETESWPPWPPLPRHGSRLANRESMSNPTPHFEAADTARPDPDLSGRELGDYRLLRRLGRGAMAEVYLAEQVSLRRQVAFKVLKRSLAADPSYVRRFHNEAQAAARLVHANIVQIHDVGCLDGVHYIAQEYVPGQNLRQLLTRSGPLDIRRTVGILRQVAAALHKAGQQGIIHRDIKPENIMIAASGEVKVADFGLARVAGEAVNLTQVGITMGTPLYMSPEQAEGREIDPRSDIYSLGVTAYQMLAGRPPFEGETALAIAVQHVKSEAERLENLRPDVPAGLCRIVHCMLAKRPADRYAQAIDLLRELRGLAIEGLADDDFADEPLDAAEITAALASRTAATQRLAVLMSESPPGPSSRGSAVFWLLGVVGAFLLGATVAWWHREPPLLDTNGGNGAVLVARQADAEAQYVYAVMLNSEPAWKSVWEYFPPEEGALNQYYARRARQQLARLYLDRKDYALAMAIFTELAGLDAVEQEFIAFGLAGQAIVYDAQGDVEKAAEKVAAVAPLKPRLDPQMRDALERLLRKREGGG
jgi:serine/threonine protein kinase